MSDLAELENRAIVELNACADETALRLWNTKYFGDSGEVKRALAGIGQVPKDQRTAYGKDANRVKEALTAAFDSKLAVEKDRAIEESLSRDSIDVTLPGRSVERRPSPSRYSDASRDLRDLRRHGIPGLSKPRGRR